MQVPLKEQHIQGSERYVSKWWQKDEREVPKPWGVHGFLGGEMGFEAVLSGATMNDACTI